MGIIAVVDDDMSLCDALVGLIDSYGYCVCGFSSAEALLSSDDLGSVIFVLTDAQMPGLSGYELLAELQARSARMPVVIMTARLDDQLETHASTIGAVDFLRKPFDGARLMAILAGHIRTPG